MRYIKILHGLYTKSRHFGLSVITSSQKLNALAPIVRLNTSSLYIFKLKNQAELDTFIQEQSALIDKKTMLEIYRTAVDAQPYSFLFVKLREVILIKCLWCVLKPKCILISDIILK